MGTLLSFIIGTRYQSYSPGQQHCPQLLESLSVSLLFLDTYAALHFFWGLLSSLLLLPPTNNNHTHTHYYT